MSKPHTRTDTHTHTSTHTHTHTHTHTRHPTRTCSQTPCKNFYIICSLNQIKRLNDELADGERAFEARTQERIKLSTALRQLNDNHQILKTELDAKSDRVSDFNI